MSASAWIRVVTVRTELLTAGETSHAAGESIDDY